MILNYYFGGSFDVIAADVAAVEGAGYCVPWFREIFQYVGGFGCCLHYVFLDPETKWQHFSFMNGDVAYCSSIY